MNAESVEIKRPSIELFPAFIEFAEEMKTHNEHMWAPYLPKPEDTPIQFVERLLNREHSPELPLVPETIYWAVFDKKAVGRISLRTENIGSNKTIKKNGGILTQTIYVDFIKENRNHYWIQI